MSERDAAVERTGQMKVQFDRLEHRIDVLNVSFLGMICGY